MALEEDTVTLTLGSDTVVITQSYSIRASILQQPAQFTIQLGNGGVAEELIRSYPPKTRFQLAVNGRVVQTGFVDGVSSDDFGGATLITFKGRDVIARLFDSFLTYEESFQESTYADLVRKQLDAVGLTGATISLSNEANRMAITGVKLVEVTPPVVEAEFTISGEIEFREVVPGTTKTVYRTLKAKLGTRRYEFLKRQLDRAGLFLFASGSGNFVISRPTANQDPVALLYRQRGSSREPGAILKHRFENDTTHRYTKCVVYGHGGGRNFGRTKNRGEWVDPEMTALLGSEDAQPLVVHDDDAKTPKQAEFYARRRIAESCRDGWQLTYTIPGHSLESLQGGMAIPAPDTVVEVDDRELGIRGRFYVETVEMSRRPQTETTLRLMKPEHLVFGDGLF